MHDLQTLFAAEEGERQWEDHLTAQFAVGDLGAVSDVLEEALIALDSELARECLALRPETVELTGWEELVEAITVHEGEPIGGVALAIANEADRAFEKGQLHHPFMMLGLYCNEPFDFTRADAAELITQTRSEEGPAWAGYDEDIEVYLDLEGLDRLNTKLLHHKQRHFFRDGNPTEAPARYVEYVLGCWWRALLYQQAVAAECAIHGLPGGIPVISGMVDMRPEIVMVHGIGARTLEPKREEEVKPASPILAADFIQIRTVEEVKEFTGADLRRKVVETGQEDEPPVKKGFMARLFGFRRRA
ncbi:hypothetical protein [Qipengyuania marisflavi]|uniref:Uncharacterized protein n=1 Tax=Qipengyuania marisflavi TaxID=2486356 RepID=A0A5S3P1V9_9SPHN|nr:hypothetical protein [Qipengyuania marisflavi]TMM46722.1 hypothetical protein FEV51_10845 [Qipengyuania marisflavi]